MLAIDRNNTGSVFKQSIASVLSSLNDDKEASSSELNDDKVDNADAFDYRQCLLSNQEIMSLQPGDRIDYRDENGNVILLFMSIPVF